MLDALLVTNGIIAELWLLSPGPSGGSQLSRVSVPASVHAFALFRPPYQVIVWRYFAALLH